MSKTHYDEFINDGYNEESLEIIDASVRKMKKLFAPIGCNDITYIKFKQINEEYIDRENYEDTYWQLLYALFGFTLAGKKIYEIAPSLCERFSATHIKVVPTELLQMPFFTILLKIPRGVLTRRWEKIDRETYVSDIYVRESYDEQEKSRILKLFVVYRDKNDDSRQTTMNFTIFLSKPTVEECVIRSINIINEYFDSGLYEREGVHCDKPTEQDLKMLQDVFSFIMKSVLYIVGAESDIVYEDTSAPLFQKLQRVKSGGKRKEIERKIANAGSPRYRVGSRIVLSRGEKLMYEGIKTGKWSLSYRFCVAGHFRNQAYGEGHQLRKVIFIQPFWKGSDISEVISKEHYVK